MREMIIRWLRLDERYQAKARPVSKETLQAIEDSTVELWKETEKGYKTFDLDIDDDDRLDSIAKLRALRSL